MSRIVVRRPLRRERDVGPAFEFGLESRDGAELVEIRAPFLLALDLRVTPVARGHGRPSLFLCHFHASTFGTVNYDATRSANFPLCFARRVR